MNQAPEGNASPATLDAQEAQQPTCRVLLLADTHLGFDQPFSPRVKKRRRGPDFFVNTERALQPALDGDVDVVIHGGDLLYRSKVPARLVSMAFEPLLRVADTGVPVVLGNVPGLYIYTFSLNCSVSPREEEAMMASTASSF